MSGRAAATIIKTSHAALAHVLAVGVEDRRKDLGSFST